MAQKKKIRNSGKEFDIISTLNDKFGAYGYDNNADFYDVLSDLEKKTKGKRPSEDPAFKKHAAANQWKERRDRGLSWRMDVFAFIEDVYGDWIERARKAGRPLTQADIKAVDLSLWYKFQQEASKRDVPDTLDLPKERKSILEGIDDPDEIKRRETVRNYERQRSRRRRNILNKK